MDSQTFASFGKQPVAARPKAKVRGDRCGYSFLVITSDLGKNEISVIFTFILTPKYSSSISAFSARSSSICFAHSSIVPCLFSQKNSHRINRFSGITIKFGVRPFLTSPTTLKKGKRLFYQCHFHQVNNRERRRELKLLYTRKTLQNHFVKEYPRQSIKVGQIKLCSLLK